MSDWPSPPWRPRQCPIACSNWLRLDGKRENDYQKWLSPSTSPADAEAMLKPFPAEKMEAWIVSKAPCCMDRRCGRTEPYPCSGLCDADVFRASQLQHSVQHVGRDRHLDRLSPVGLRPQPLAEDALPARDIGLHQGARVVP